MRGTNLRLPKVLIDCHGKFLDYDSNNGHSVKVRVTLCLYLWERDILSSIERVASHHYYLKEFQPRDPALVKRLRLFNIAFASSIEHIITDRISDNALELFESHLTVYMQATRGHPMWEICYCFVADEPDADLLNSGMKKVENIYERVSLAFHVPKDIIKKYFSCHTDERYPIANIGFCEESLFDYMKSFWEVTKYIAPESIVPLMIGFAQGRGTDLFQKETWEELKIDSRLRSIKRDLAITDKQNALNNLYEDLLHWIGQTLRPYLYASWKLFVCHRLNSEVQDLFYKDFCESRVTQEYHTEFGYPEDRSERPFQKEEGQLDKKLFVKIFKEKTDEFSRKMFDSIKKKLEYIQTNSSYFVEAKLKLDDDSAILSAVAKCIKDFRKRELLVLKRGLKKQSSAEEASAEDDSETEVETSESGSEVASDDSEGEKKDGAHPMVPLSTVISD